MKGSSKKTMITAAVLMALSSGTASAATSGTVDSQELFHSNRLVTDQTRQPKMEENTASDSYEASISAQKKSAAAPVQKQTSHTAPQRAARLHWDDVDTRIAARSNTPAFTLSAQKAKPVIITAADVKRETKQAEKEGRASQQLVGRTNMQGEGLPHVEVVPENEPPRVIPPRPAVPSVPPEDMHQEPAQNMPVPPPPMQGSQMPIDHMHQPAAQMPTQAAVSVPQQSMSMAAVGGEEVLQKPERPRYAQMPHEQFTLNPPADMPAPPKKPERFDSLDAPLSQGMRQEGHSLQAVPERSVRPEGVPALTPRPQQMQDDTLAGISDEVRRHILAGQLAMEIQLKKDPTVEGMRALTQVLRDNTTLTKLQKIDFLIGFGRALHRSDLPRQQQSLLIKTIADSF